MFKKISKIIVISSIFAVISSSAMADSFRFVFRDHGNKIAIGAGGHHHDHWRHHHRHHHDHWRHHGRTVIKKQHCNHHRCVTKKVIKRY